MAEHVLYCAGDYTAIPEINLGKLLLDRFHSYPKNTTALIDLNSGQSQTYEQLIELSQNLTSNLHNLGIRKDDVMAIISENSTKSLVALLAGFNLAAPLHWINFKSTQYELKHLLNMSKPKLVFFSKKSQNNLMKLGNDLNFVQNFVLFDDGDDGNDEKFILYKNLVSKPNQTYKIVEDVDIEEQTAIILNSSGTTGLPKGVMLTHNNFRKMLIFARHPDIYSMEPNRAILLVVPLYHIYGLHLALCAFFAGSTVITMDGFNAKIFLETVQKHKIEQLFLVPSLINFFANSSLIESYDLSSLNYVFTAGAPMLDCDAQSLQSKLNLKTVRWIYGMTETAGLCLQFPKDELGPRGNCGKVSPGLKMKIVDIETQRKLGPNQNGELCFKGNNMKGYLNQIEATEEAFDSDGFLRTGDLGYYDEKGFVHIVGRIKEIIKYKCFQVSPIELENILLLHPSIKDVAVVGRSDRRFGEVPVGFVVKEESAEVTEQEIVDYLAEFVSEEKQLHGGVRFVETIPRNDSGKIIRAQLSKMLEY